MKDSHDLTVRLRFLRELGGDRVARSIVNTLARAGIAYSLADLREYYRRFGTEEAELRLLSLPQFGKKCLERVANHMPPEASGPAPRTVFYDADTLRDLTYEGREGRPMTVYAHDGTPVTLTPGDPASGCHTGPREAGLDTLRLNF